MKVSGHLTKGVNITVDSVESKKNLIALLGSQLNIQRKRFNAPAKIKQSGFRFIHMKLILLPKSRRSKRLTEVKRTAQAFVDSTDRATQMFTIRTAMQQEIQIVHGFLMPDQTLNSDVRHSKNQHQRNGKQRDQPSANGANQKHADLPVDIASFGQLAKKNARDNRQTGKNCRSAQRQFNGRLDLRPEMSAGCEIVQICFENRRFRPVCHPVCRSGVLNHAMKKTLGSLQLPSVFRLDAGESE
jgi:hypothetical protein